jgi:hypothetical protein
MKLLQLISSWRSTRVLDDRKVGSVAREEAVVHALLRNRDAAPMEAAPEGLRRAIAMRLERTQPQPVRPTFALSRGLLVAAPVLMLALGGAMLLHTRSQSTPTTLSPVVQRPFTPIVSVRADDSGVAGFPAGTVDEGLLTAGPLVTPRRATPAWMRELPGAPARTNWASDKVRPDPLLMEARELEFTGRTAAQVLIANQLKNQQKSKREE